MQDKKPTAFYSRKLNAAQRRYTTTERELLSTIETLINKSNNKESKSRIPYEYKVGEQILLNTPGILWMLSCITLEASDLP